MSQYANGKQALLALAEAYRVVDLRRGQYDEAQSLADARMEKLIEAQEIFNDVRDQAVQLCPELLNGYPVGQTVKVVDGEITVVEE